MKTPEEFWAKTEHDELGCLLWRGAISDTGYGCLRWEGRTVLAHRLAYQLTHGEGSIPKGMHLDHLCRRPACVSPAHLEPVTPLVNARRAQIHMPGMYGSTACARGHEWTPESTYYEQGGRKCLTCRNAWRAAYTPVAARRKREARRRAG